MNKDKLKKILDIGYKYGIKALSFCAVAVAMINVNSTSCWIHGQPTPPKSLKKYRKF